MFTCALRARSDYLCKEIRVTLPLSPKTPLPNCTVQNPTRPPGIAVIALQPRCSLLRPRIQRGLPGSSGRPGQRLGPGRCVDILGAGPCAGESVWVSGIESRARETRPRGRVCGGNPRPQLGAQPRTGVNTAVGSLRRFTSSQPRRADWDRSEASCPPTSSDGTGAVRAPGGISEAASAGTVPSWAPRTPDAGSRRVRGHARRVCRDQR